MKNQNGKLTICNNNNNTKLDQQQEQQGFHHWEDSLMMYALSFLDVKTLLQKVTVYKTWRKLCKTKLRNKCCGRQKAFQSKEELKNAIWKYYRCKTRNCKRETMEEIACTYGYPMDTWDVLQIKDMSNLFRCMDSFNEYMGSWNVSNVTNMSCMFYWAKSFNPRNRELGYVKC
jgi:hypothetical protein